MSAFEDFVQTEIPKRPFTATDGIAGQLLVRSTNPLAARELVWIDSGGLMSVVKTAGVTMGGQRAVVLDSAGEAVYADNTDLTHLYRLLGLTTHAVAAAAPVTIHTYGEIADPSWSWTPALPVFLSTAGLLTQTPPTSGFLITVGFAVTATSLFFRLREPIALF